MTGEWRIQEIGKRPDDVRFVYNPRQTRSEIWWAGHLIAWWSDAQQIIGAEGIINWNEVRDRTFKPMIEPFPEAPF